LDEDRFPHMLRRTARTLLIAALVLSIGLHWVVLQSAAWAGMIVAYSIQEGSLLTGMSQTFDNEHPCPLCRAIKDGKQSEKKDTKQADQKKKIDFTLLAASSIRLSPPAPRLTWARNDVDESGSQFSHRPPSPPPRRGEA
jgi:hypothetical protein